MKLQEKIFFFFGGGGGGRVRGDRVWGGGCQGGYERRSEVFVKFKKNKKKIRGGGGRAGGVRAGVGVGEGVARFGVGG